MSESTAFISGVISLIISAAVAILIGDRWVERAQRKRFHSQKLTEVINKFFTSFSSLFPIDSIYDYDVHRFEDAKVTGFQGFDQGKFLEEHIRSGYPEVSSKVDEYLVAHKKLMNFNKNVKNDLSARIIKYAEEVNIPLYKPGYQEQDEYFNVDSYIRVFVNQLNEISNGRGDPELKRFESKRTTLNGCKCTQVYWDSSCILMVKNEDHANVIKTRTRFLFDSELIRSQFKEYHDEEENLRIKYNELNAQLTEIRNYIELGNTIKGKCSACPYKRFF